MDAMANGNGKQKENTVTCYNNILRNNSDSNKRIPTFTSPSTFGSTGLFITKFSFHFSVQPNITLTTHHNRQSFPL